MLDEIGKRVGVIAVQKDGLLLMVERRSQKNEKRKRW
jgi:hypothetical protein